MREFVKARSVSKLNFCKNPKRARNYKLCCRSLWMLLILPDMREKIRLQPLIAIFF